MLEWDFLYLYLRYRNSFTGVSDFFCLHEQGLGQMNDDAATGWKKTCIIKGSDPLMIHKIDKTTMAKKKQPMTMVPGKVYDGSAMINEFGEMLFTPYQHKVGASPPKFRTITGSKDVNDFQLLQCKDKVRIVLTVDRLQPERERKENLKELFIKAIQKLEEYDI